MGKRLLTRLIGSLFILVMLGGAGAAGWWNWAIKPYAEEGSGKTGAFTVTQGMSASQIAQELQKKQFIRNAWAFRLLATRENADSKLYAGDYFLSSEMSPQEMIGKLTAGPEYAATRVTIPEGYTTAQIVDYLADKGFGTKEELAGIIANEPFDYAFLQDMPKDQTRLDGLLFPDTYFVDKNTTPKMIIDMMLNRFDQEVTKEAVARIKELNLSLREWITLASIVEKEAGIDADRPIIAGVFINRLKINMPLQSDATVQYILGTNKYIHSLDDIKVESPYNTYIHTGLPPGPIASPGHASLAAVLHYTQSDYLYFISKKDGSSVFAKTLQEQTANQYKYMK